jgi:hypothetical protein
MSNLASGGKHQVNNQNLKNNDDLSDSNILVCKSLLNISHCYGAILDVKSWYSIFETLQKVEKVITKKLHLMVGTLEKYQNRPIFNKDGNQTLVNFSELRS